MSDEGVAYRLKPLAERILGTGPPLRIRAWDGSEIGPRDAPAVVLHDRRALRRLLWKPGETGLVRAYLAGEIDVDGDLVGVLGRLFDIARRGGDGALRLTPRQQSEIVRTAVMLGAVGPEPAPPEDEDLLGVLRYGPDSDGGLADHLRMPIAFHERMLGTPMTYSAGRWTDGVDDLAGAQEAAFDEIGRTLDLAPGLRVLDLGCGFGALADYLARKYGAYAAGVTPVAEHAAYARDRAAAAGVAGRTEFRVADVDAAAAMMRGAAPYDAVVSVGGAAEHAAGDVFPEAVRELLRPGGTLLLARLAGAAPDGPMPSLGAVITGLEAVDVEVREAYDMRADYARTIRGWIANLTGDGTPAGPVRARLLVLAGTAVGLEAGRLGAYRITAGRRANAAFG